MEKEPEITRTSLRLPKQLYEKLAHAAEARGMTMHAEILARLDASFATSGFMSVQETGADTFTGSGQGGVTHQAEVKFRPTAEFKQELEKIIEETIDNSIDAKIRKYGLLLGKESDTPVELPPASDHGEGSRTVRSSYIGPDRHRPQPQHFPDRPKKG